VFQLRVVAGTPKIRSRPGDLVALADHDLGIEWESAHQFGAELRPGDPPPDHKRARGTDVDGIEVLQLLGERIHLIRASGQLGELGVDQRVERGVLRREILQPAARLFLSS